MKYDFKKFFGHIKNTKVLSIIFILGIAMLIFPIGNSEEKDKIKSENEIDFLEYKGELEESLEGYIKYLQDNDDELPEGYYQSRTAKRRKENDKF